MTQNVMNSHTNRKYLRHIHAFSCFVLLYSCRYVILKARTFIGVWVISISLE